MSEPRIRVTGEREAQAAIAAMAARATALEPAQKEILDHLRAVHARAFRTAGANLPKPWRALAQSTRQTKAERGDDPRVLVRRGDLERSLTVRGARYAREGLGGGGIEFGTSSPVARLLRARGRSPVQKPADAGPIVAILRRHVGRAG